MASSRSARAPLLPLGELGVRLEQQPDAVRIFEEVARHQALEPAAALEPAPDVRQVGVELQHAQRVAAVDPGAADPEQQPEAVRVGGVGDLAPVELQLVDGGLGQVPVDPVRRQALECPEHDPLDRLRRLGGHVLEPGREVRVAVLGVVPAAVRQRRAQARVDQRLAQRGGGVAEQDLLQQREAQHRTRVADVAREPGDARLVPPRGVLGAPEREWEPGAARGRPARLRGHVGRRVDRREPVQDGAGDDLQVRVQGQVPVAEEVGVARVVVPAVELAQLRVGEVRDLAGIAAGVEGVGRVRVERLQDRTRHHLVGRGHGPLHLVVDHPLEHRALAVGRGLELQAVALLLEAQLLQPREERRVQVDVHQVVEVFPVLGREGVHRPVGGREGVHEGAQAALEHGEKGVPHREALGAAEHDVLEDVRDPAGVPRDGLEQHPEGVLRIRPADVDVVRARGGVSELVEDRVDLGQSLHAQHLVVADPIAGLQAGPVGRTDWFHGPPETVSGRGKRKGSRRDPALPAGGRMELRGAPTAPRTRPGCDA